MSVRLHLLTGRLADLTRVTLEPISCPEMSLPKRNYIPRHRVIGRL
jgi:hypothetical protein